MYFQVAHHYTHSIDSGDKKCLEHVLVIDNEKRTVHEIPHSECSRYQASVYNMTNRRNIAFTHNWELLLLSEAGCFPHGVNHPHL